MSQIRKEEANGELYTASQYSSGFIPGLSQRQREARKQQSSIYKQTINRKDSEWNFVKKANANFLPGRDLFTCLTFRELPQSERTCLQEFHAAVRKGYAKLGLKHGYMIVRETHSMDDVPVRLHFHLFMWGANGPGMYQKLLKIIEDAWPYGSVDVRILNDGGDLFKSTVGYLMKEKRAKGERAYSCSRNLKPPAEPVRQRVKEKNKLETPPGVKMIKEHHDANEFCQMSFYIGRIVDPIAFAAYWEKTKKEARPDPWERLRRRKHRLQ